MISASTRISFKTSRASAITSSRDDGAIAGADFRDEMSAICRADDRSAARHDAGGAAAIEDHVISRREETFEAVEKSENFPAQFFRREDDSAQHGVQARDNRRRSSETPIRGFVICEAENQRVFFRIRPRGRRRPIDRKAASRARAFAPPSPKRFGAAEQ